MNMINNIFEVIKAMIGLIFKAVFVVIAPIIMASWVFGQTLQWFNVADNNIIISYFVTVLFIIFACFAYERARIDGKIK